MATARDKQAWATYPPSRHLRAAMRDWPNMRRTLDTLREEHMRGVGEFEWPDECYLPAQVAFTAYCRQHPEYVRAATSGSLSRDERDRPMTIAGAYTWAAAKLCCRFDADLYAELADQPLDGELPKEVKEA